jgi:hypothetical protein
MTMKIKHLLLATSVALVPATASLADRSAIEAAKKKKEEARAAAIEKAKAEAREKAAAAAEENKRKAAAAKAKAGAAAAANAADAEEAAKAALETHQKHLGMIERLEQIATATDNAELKAKVGTLREKEMKRHGLATGG